MYRSMAIALVATTALAFVSVTPARSLQIAPLDGCADCHFARPDAPGLDHVRDWDRSPHGRNDVSCVACHGGNPRTFERALAHRDIVPPRRAASPLNVKNLPETCGRCHAGPYDAFRESRHYQLLRSGSVEGPTCTTCHGETDGRLPSAKALGSLCGGCHSPAARAPREGRVTAASELYEGVAAVHAELKMADGLIKRVGDRARRAELTKTYQSAQTALTRSIDAGHRFVYDDLRRELGDAQMLVEPLLSELVNRD